MTNKIAVVIPSYKVKKHIVSVLSRIGPEVTEIFVVDDRCPEKTGLHVKSNCSDERIKVIFNPENKGVGGATIEGFREALKRGADVIVKIDGDGQMAPELIPRFVRPLLEGKSDYTKGNRFYAPELLEGMPKVRVIGNVVLSFINKLTSGYWNIMDPTNGFIAIRSSVLRVLPLQKIDDRYFFETDMLFRLYTFRAVVKEIPMESVYGEERSNLKISNVSLEFPKKHLQRFIKRIYYMYFMRDFNVCSLEIIFGIFLLLFGTAFGLRHWYLSIALGTPATTGTVMLAALPTIMGFQLLLASIHFDVTNIPTEPISQNLLLTHEALADFCDRSFNIDEKEGKL